MIGINNRNLTDFSVDTRRTYELLADVPAGKIVVSESGISTREQIEELERVGVDAVLAGSAVMAAEDPETAVAPRRSLTSSSAPRSRVGSAGALERPLPSLRWRRRPTLILPR